MRERGGERMNENEIFIFLYFCGNGQLFIKVLAGLHSLELCLKVAAQSGTTFPSILCI